MANRWPYWVGSYLSAEVQLVYFTAPTDRLGPSSEAVADNINTVGSNQKSIEPGGEVGSVLLPAAWSLHPYYQPKQTMWNLTQHSQQTNHRCSLIPTALRRANFRKTSEIPFGLLTTLSWQRPQDDNTAARTNCRPAPA